MSSREKWKLYENSIVWPLAAKISSLARLGVRWLARNLHFVPSKSAKLDVSRNCLACFLGFVFAATTWELRKCCFCRHQRCLNAAALVMTRRNVYFFALASHSTVVVDKFQTPTFCHWGFCQVLRKWDNFILISDDLNAHWLRRHKFWCFIGQLTFLEYVTHLSASVGHDGRILNTLTKCSKCIKTWIFTSSPRTSWIFR